MCEKTNKHYTVEAHGKEEGALDAQYCSVDF